MAQRMSEADDLAAELIQCEEILKELYRKVTATSYKGELFFHVEYAKHAVLQGVGYSFEIGYVCGQLGGRQQAHIEPDEKTVNIYVPSYKGRRSYEVYITFDGRQRQ